MTKLFRRLFARLFGPRSSAAQPTPQSTQAPAKQVLDTNSDAVTHFDGPAGHLVPFDENLLERARTQWQFGDWQSLAQLDRDTLQHHPDRAKLALLAASGHQQTGDMAQAKHYIRLAQDWGCSQKLIKQILIAGTHNTLARAAAVLGQEKRALKHFETAIDTGSPYADRLIKQARTAFQLNQLGVESPMLIAASRSHNK